MCSAREIPWRALVGREVEAAPVTTAGRNSRIYRLVLDDGRVLAGKAYYRSAADTRDRLGAERAGLTLCREAGLAVPEVLAFDSDLGALVLQWVDGGPVVGLGEADVDAAVRFLRVLADVGAGLGDPGSVGPASEACFSGPDLAANLEKRFARLEAARGDEPEYADMARLLAEMRQEADRRLDLAEKSLGRAWAETLPRSECVLSPSDFGFHNALRCADGSLCFLDFEYFGWDDPAKTVCDFVLHPAMNVHGNPAGGAILDEDLAARFAARAVRGLDRGGLVARSLALHPLYTLKWCCIFLNEFVADDRARRRFAGLDARREALRAQLHKTRTYLENMDESYERFRASVA